MFRCGSLTQYLTSLELRAQSFSESVLKHFVPDSMETSSCGFFVNFFSELPCVPRDHLLSQWVLWAFTVPHSFLPDATSQSTLEEICAPLGQLSEKKNHFSRWGSRLFNPGFFCFFSFHNSQMQTMRRSEAYELPFNLWRLSATVLLMYRNQRDAVFQSVVNGTSSTDWDPKWPPAHDVSLPMQPLFTSRANSFRNYLLRSYPKPNHHTLWLPSENQVLRPLKEENTDTVIA